MKDSIDIVLLRNAAFSNVVAVRHAVAATFERGATHEFPERIDVPEQSWAEEYRKMAIDVRPRKEVRTVELGVAVLDDVVNAIRGVS